MDAILEELYDLEMKAQGHEAGVSDHKLNFKHDFEDRKKQLDAQFQADFQEKLAKYHSQASQEREAVIGEMTQQFSDDMQKINQAVENDQPKYVANFMAKVKALGVNHNE